MKKINITLLSDTHTKHMNVGIVGGDLILHSGDIMNSGYDPEDLHDFLEWFSELPYKMKVFIPGNHDRLIEDKPWDAWKMINFYHDKGVRCLIDDFVEFEGLKIYGSPWQPEFFNWAFNLPRNGKELEEKWNNIPDDTDILLTHGPAWGILDTVVNRRDVNLGCELLAKRFETLNPLLHLCGHIHTGYGYVEKNGTHFFNASVLDERYRYNQKPFEITIDLETKQLNIL